MSAARPHVALVCWGFPPFRGSGAFRPLALANSLAAAGADVTVVTASREVFLVQYGADPTLERHVDPRVELVRVPFYPSHAWPLMNDWPQARVSAPKKFAAQHDPATDYFPEKVYASWLPRVSEALFELHRRKPISLVLGTGAPYVDDEAAALLGANYGIPVVLDDRDSFLADVFTGQPAPLYEERRPYFERWLEICAEMWFVNPPIAQWHRDRFPEHADRIRVVENGWDPGVVDAARIAGVATGPLKAGYVGLVPSNFPMDPVLAAWAGIMDDDSQPAASLRFVGPLGYEVDSEKWKRMESAIAAAPHVEWAGHHPREQLAEIYADLDVLLLIKEGGQMVTGGKTYEYAATGLPIAALVDPASDAVRVLRDYPRLYVADPHDPAAAKAAIAAAMADRITDDGSRLRAAQRFGETLRREEQLGPHVERIVKLAQR